ncbi:MAG: M56 family metallopeptidase [Propioniciclava sp.]
MIIGGAILLGAVAVALAWPVPILLVRASWPMRQPILALVWWQMIGLGGGVSIMLALALSGVALLPDHRLIGLLPAAGFGGYLLAHLGVTFVQVTRLRRRHLALLELLTSPHPTRTATRVLDDAAPVAYCLPAGIGSVTVLSRGLLERLAPDELAAVVAHERAHARQRHDLLLLAFRAWRSALPWFWVAARAESEVAVLVEMVADDYARREVPDEVLVRAILSVGAPEGPEMGPVRGHAGGVSKRFHRLTSPAPEKPIG